jgi:glyoxylase-like metal-dependent hydrolase (beta-lactamase superfamily II)
MVALSHRVARVRAPNPSPMTLSGTNTYIVRIDKASALVIDPGPAIDAHVHSILSSVDEMELTVHAILVTHGHPDHAPAAEPLSHATGAPIYAHREPTFRADFAFEDREAVQFDDATLTVIDAPGHAVDHLVFYLREEKALFTGDVVLGEGTVVVAPPGGAMRPYQRTLQRLLDEYGDSRAIYGGHGEAVLDPRAKLVEYIAHRRMREDQLLRQLEHDPATIPVLVSTIYSDVDRRLWPAAARQMLAHLIALEEENRVVPRLLERPPTPEESEILDPNLMRIADPAAAEVVRAELGTAVRLPLIEYRLA